MAEAATHPYNLRSREETVELPVQLQLSDDTRFMSDLLANNNKENGQVSDTDSSIDERDCEALLIALVLVLRMFVILTITLSRIRIRP